MKEVQRYLQVPLADELFDCISGPFASFVTVESNPGGPYRRLQYHTYVNTVVGTLEDSDVETTLRMTFEAYLRRLHERTANPNLPGRLPGSKPRLFWRFRKGEHISLEWNGKKKGSLVQLRTRLVVPDCSLNFCPLCLHTEGENHAAYCENIVGRSLPCE